jgi:hypothetical protein
VTEKLFIGPGTGSKAHCRLLHRGAKWPGHEANHLPTSSVEVKNTWGYTSTPPCIWIAWCVIKHQEHLMFTVRMQNLVYSDKMRMICSTYDKHLKSISWRNLMDWGHFRDVTRTYNIKMNHINGGRGYGLNSSCEEQSPTAGSWNPIMSLWVPQNMENILSTKRLPVSEKRNTLLEFIRYTV